MKARTILISLACIITMYGFSQEQHSAAAMVIPHLNERCDFQQNIVYASGLRAAWTSLKENVLGEDIKTEKPLSVVHHLNQMPYRTKVSNYAVCSGLVKDGVIDQIIKDMQVNFNREIRDFDMYRDREDVIICYSYFGKQLRFPGQFAATEGEFSYKGSRVKVRGFGFGLQGNVSWKEEMLKQVEVHDYQDQDDFIIRLKTPDSDHDLILAKIDPGRTLLNTYKTVHERMNSSGPEHPGIVDKLIIPVINLSVVKNYEQLLGVHLLNPGFEDYFFDVVQQRVDLTMDEAGVTIMSDAEIILKKGHKPRVLAFDKPFLLIIDNKLSGEPDLVAWIADPGFLLPVE